MNITPKIGRRVADSLAQIQVPSELRTSEFTNIDDRAQRDLNSQGDLIELRRFCQNQDVLNIVVDVKFLKHVIRTLITNHDITTTPHDLECIMSYYGDVEIKTEKQVVKHRGIKKGMCTKVDSDEVIDIVQKILVNGVNVVRKIPDFIEFIQSLGLSL
jgi:hypothetical protein